MRLSNNILNSASIILLLFFTLAAYGQVNSDPTHDSIQREFRAAWIATVANINWPSKPGLSVSEQKSEAIELLDLLKSCNYNAAIFQVRPQADALYCSDLEPWSYFLTGTQGSAPEDYYDPLEFWIEEAHKRCIELHAWINPYRAHHKDGGKLSEYSIVKQKPELVLQLKEGYWWFDPSREETQDHVYTIVMDIARRYDIDGIHFDDYFYPYPSYNGESDFPDSVSWKNYLEDGGKLSKQDWRRNNVNVFIERVYRGLKLMKPHVKFGLSPFGIWRPNNPSSIKGFDQYNELYADAKLWLNKGWLDYFSPQLYWPINKIEQSFPILLSWWQSQNYKGRYLWPGSNISRGSDEVINQIMIARAVLGKGPGNVHWSIAPLINDPSLSIDLMSGPYKHPALVPSCSWLWNKLPKVAPSSFAVDWSELLVEQNFQNVNKYKKWVVYFKCEDEWHYEILPSTINSYDLKTSGHFCESDHNEKIQHVGISVVDRFGNESEVIYFNPI